VPAFLDRETGKVYISRTVDGRPAPVHLLDGLPEEVVVRRSSSGAVSAIKSSVVVGFIREDRFYTREQTACVLAIGRGAVRIAGAQVSSVT
jgi:hypothetical protein